MFGHSGSPGQLLYLAPGTGRRERLNQRRYIRREIAIRGYRLSRSRMNKFEARRMQGEAVNLPLRSLFRSILSVPDHRMTNRQKLHPDLILQSGDERDADERCVAKLAFHRVSQLGAGALGIAVAG